MFEALRNRMAGKKSKPPAAAVPAGQRIYAVGDIHGRLDLFEAMIAAIDADDAARKSANTTIVLLGDLIDRGPDSAGVVKRARKLQKARAVRILAGNHEDMFLRSFDERDVLRHFIRHGGKETLLSYGVPKKAYNNSSLEELQKLMNEHVPEKDRVFVEGFEDAVLVGDYLFVHAGIRPGVALDEQTRQDMRWIREPFLGHKKPHGPVVVHGHTISDEPEDRGNRIGLDTGAFRSGRLTAIVLEGTSREYLEARQTKKGKIKAGLRELA
ncbi:metallophosphoesterase family protein [Paraurantiacibacter namhicola]|uniref:Bis(5'-nucleosyl)-tetraphosphatase PrpE (Asymmetrical) n=1 Tax=Paraurantiacibacter namhicola TaxID=645517 RepID=A0A1C7DB20_9SPHN|nr:metallophosphoesterase family protein [Paraurantiacibacter namhicola]ANU08645.1 Bis(5'-nucleosyl)-tetraphosphatase PrpE (asymmetrical) [Paraurantiacibacter namhicola]